MAAKTRKFTLGQRAVHLVVFFILSVALYALVFWLYVEVLGFEHPKTWFLKRANANWSYRVELMDRRLDEYEQILNTLEQRDNDVYRSVFGMNEIPGEVREAGISGPGRYDEVEGLADGSLLKTTALRLDKLTKKAYIQSKSFDEVHALSVKAGDMATSVPSICPLYTDDRFILSSTFGYRSDPKHGGLSRHEGIDLATEIGNPVYATGDGVIEEAGSILRGYGNQILIDHGFGYQSRYAHLHTILVKKGQEVKRGDLIAYSGNSGKSTGAHLHYEVLYRKHPVNPLNYMDINLPTAEYRTMVNVVPREKGTKGRKRR